MPSSCRRVTGCFARPFTRIHLPDAVRLERAAAFAVSQSGKSPDIVALTQSARKGGALTFSLVNTLPSPLGDAADHAINIQAGPEKAVAATKSFVNSIVAGLAILAA